MSAEKTDFAGSNQTASALLPLFRRTFKNRNGTYFIARACRKNGTDRVADPQDLNCFGGFGQQGYGYNINELHEEIGRILGLDTHTSVILIGAGNLGRAIANHMPFEERGFSLIGIFDQNPELLGKKVRNIQIQSTDDLESFCARTIHLPLFSAFRKL